MPKAYVLTVKAPGQPVKHYFMQRKLHANYNAERIGRKLPKGGTVTIHEIGQGPPRVVGGVMKINPRRRRARR